MSAAWNGSLETPFVYQAAVLRTLNNSSEKQPNRGGSSRTALLKTPTFRTSLKKSVLPFTCLTEKGDEALRGRHQRLSADAQGLCMYASITSEKIAARRPCRQRSGEEIWVVANGGGEKRLNNRVEEADKLLNFLLGRTRESSRSRRKAIPCMRG